MALRLREDEILLSHQANFETLPGVESLKNMASPLRCRCIEKFLKENGVREPEQTHIHQVEALLYSDKPSARASLPGGVTVARQYDALTVLTQGVQLERTLLNCPGVTQIPGLRITCQAADTLVNTPDTFTVVPQGEVFLRSRRSGDRIRLSGGSKSLKKLFIDRKIPADRRDKIPVVCDERGILGVYQIGTNLDRASENLPAVTIRFEISEVP